MRKRRRHDTLAAGTAHDLNPASGISVETRPRDALREPTNTPGSSGEEHNNSPRLSHRNRTERLTASAAAKQPELFKEFYRNSVA